MVYTKAFKNIILTLICVCFIGFLPIRANAQTGVGSIWDGSFDVVFPQSFLYMNYSRVYEYNLTDTTAKPHNTFAVYESSDNVRIDIESYTTDVYLNGNFRVRVTASPVDVNTAFSYLTISSDPVILPGVYVSTELISRAYGGTSTYDIYIEFDNYYVDKSNISLPIKINHMLSAVWNTPNVLPSNVVKYNISVVSDYAGTVMQYDNLEDVPSLDGYFAEQNQTIINQSQTQIENQEIQNQLQQESNEQNKNFFDNFFSNLGNTVMSWLIPTADQLNDFLGRMNSWFSDRLGFIWYPFDLAIRLVSALGLGEASSVFKVPALQLNILGSNYQIWNSIDVDLDAFGIFQYVRFFTSCLLVSGIVKMAIDKWDEWIGGHSG